MTSEEVFERADEITAETRYRIQFASEVRWGPGGRAHFADPRPEDFP
jgi:hypothetical protein